MINSQNSMESKCRKPKPHFVLSKESNIKENELSSLSNNTKETSIKGIIGHDSENLPCDDGPYVWDKGKKGIRYIEGIGAQFLLRKHSFILTGLLKAKWIGQLINGHDGTKSKKSSQFKIFKIPNYLESIKEYFGISVQECNEKSLKRIESANNSFHQFFYTNEDSCIGDRVFNPGKCLHNLDMTRKTIVVFDWHKRTYDYSFSAFNHYFRYVL